MSPMRAKSVAPWLLFAVIALIVYGSLYPFNFKADAVHGGPLEALKQLTWARAGLGDRVSNVLLYIPLGFCLYLCGARVMRRWIAVVLAIAIGALLSLCIEVAQVYISPRVPSFADVTLNAIGTALGALGGIAWRGLTRFVQLPRSAGAGRGDRMAVTVVLLWLGWRLSPFIPRLTLMKLKEALRPLFHPDFDPGITATFLVYWWVVSHAVFALASEQYGLEALLVLIATVLVGRLLLADQAFIAPELLALLLLLPTLVIVNRLRPWARRMLLTTGLIAVAISQALTPFRFSTTRAAFNWWSWFDWSHSDMRIEVGWLMERFFLYGALTWLLRESGISAMLAVVSVTALVVVLSIAQLWLISGSPSITEPVIAFAAAFLLCCVDSSHRRFASRS
jgi:VanZ family protein